MRLQEKGVGDTGGGHQDGSSRGTLPPKVALVPGDVIKKFSHTKRVGTYLLGKTLGEGSFAKVKEGLHTLTGEKVAVKVIDKKKAREDVYVRKNLRREGKLLQMVRHRHVVRLFEIMETENSYYLVTELCNGGDLMEHICTKKRLDEKETRKYIRQILSAVDYLHKLGILHRDLKVENLLLDENKNIKIIDFGLSNSVEVTNNPGGSTVFHEFCVTQCGSPAYAAPELLGNSKYGPNVDIWSIGVNMFAMLTGSLPFTVEPFNIKALHKKMLKGDMNPTPEHLTKNCRDLLKKFLNPDPDMRISIREAMRHPWICEVFIKGVEEAPFPNRLTPEDLTPEVIHHMTHQLDFRPQDVMRLVSGNIPNSATATYFLLSQRLSRHEAEVATHARIHRAVKNANRQQDDNNYEITGTDVIELLPISDREDSQPHKKSSPSDTVHTQEPRVLEMTMSPRRLPREEERPGRGGNRSRPARGDDAGGGGRFPPPGPPGGPPSRDPSPRRHHPPPLTRRPSADQSPRHSPRPSPRHSPRRGANNTNNSHNNGHNNNNSLSSNNNNHVPRRGSLEPPRRGNLLPRSQSQETEGSSVAPSDIVLPDLEQEPEEGPTGNGQMIHLPHEGQKSWERPGQSRGVGGRSRAAGGKDLMNLPAVTTLNRRPSFELPVSPEPHPRLAPPDKGRGNMDRHNYNSNGGGMRPDPDRLSPGAAPYRTMSAHSADRKLHNGSSNSATSSVGRQSALGVVGGGGGGGRPGMAHRTMEEPLPSSSTGRPMTGTPGEWRSARPTTRSAYPHSDTSRGASDPATIPRKLVIDVGQYDRYARATGRIRTIASGDAEPVYVGGHRRLINLMYPAQQHNRKPGHAAVVSPNRRSPQLVRAGAVSSQAAHAQHDHNHLGVSGERQTPGGSSSLPGGGGGNTSGSGGGTGGGRVGVGGTSGGGMTPGGGLSRDTLPHAHLTSRHVEVVSQHLLETSRDLRGASSPVGAAHPCSRTPSPSYRRSPTTAPGGARVGLPAISPTPGTHSTSTRMQLEDLDK